MSHVRNLVRTGAAGTVAFAIVVAASGWLYLIRPWTADLPGPKFHDALPFDELALHAKAPLVVFLAVWLVAATLLAALVRLTRAERLTAALAGRARVVRRGRGRLRRPRRRALASPEHADRGARARARLRSGDGARRSA